MIVRDPASPLIQSDRHVVLADPHPGLLMIGLTERAEAVPCRLSLIAGSYEGPHKLRGEEDGDCFDLAIADRIQWCPTAQIEQASIQPAAHGDHIRTENLNEEEPKLGK